MNRLYTSFMILIGLWKAFCDKSDQNCVKIELVNNPSNDNIITVEENRVVNLTFYVNTQACTQSAPHCMLKLSVFEKGLYIDKCKIPYGNMTCQERTSQDMYCSCLNSDKPSVQFRQSFNGSHYKVYYWRGMQCFDATPTEVELLKIIFVIFKTTLRPTQEMEREETDVKSFCHSLYAVIAACTSAAITIVVIAIIIIVRKSSVRRFSDAAIHSHQVNSEVGRQPADSDVYYHLSRR